MADDLTNSSNTFTMPPQAGAQPVGSAFTAPSDAQAPTLPTPAPVPSAFPPLETHVPDALPAAGPQNMPSFQDPSLTQAPVQPLVPVEPVSTTLQDAWQQEVAAPLGQVNPPIAPALPDAQVFASSAPVEVLPPLATQLPQQAPEAHPAVVSDVTGAPTPSPFDVPSSLESSQETPDDSQPPQQPPFPGPGDSTGGAGDLGVLGDAPPADGADGEEKKSPLEILEEILAGANAEKDMKEKEELEKKALEEKEAAEFAAKEAAFAEEAKVKLAETSTAIEEAKQQREKVEAELAENAPKNDMPDTLAIHQLSHDTIQTTH